MRLKSKSSYMFQSTFIFMYGIFNLITIYKNLTMIIMICLPNFRLVDDFDACRSTLGGIRSTSSYPSHFSVSLHILLIKRPLINYNINQLCHPQFTIKLTRE